jgi:tetratricopeptide (TPR) repeat protein
LEPIGRLDVLDDVATKAKEYFDRLPKELLTAPRLKQQTGMFDNLGEVLEAQGKLQDALDAYRQGLAISKLLVEQDKSNLGWQRNLSVNYDKVGEVLVAQGKLQDALDAYQQCLAISKRLAEQDKSNLGWQRDLSVSYERVGDVLVAQGKLQDGLDAHQKALKIGQTLAGQDPTNAVWQNATAWSRYCVAKVLIQIKDGDRNEARRLVIEGIDIMNRLEHQGALDTDAQDTLNKLNELATALTSSPTN